MDKIEKFLRKLSPEQRAIVTNLIERILKGDTLYMDVQKLQGYPNVFRVRKGNIRIIFKRKNEQYFILSIEYKSDTTYNL